MNGGHSYTLSVITVRRCVCVRVRVGKRGPRPQTATVEAPRRATMVRTDLVNLNRKQLETWLPPRLTGWRLPLRTSGMLSPPRGVCTWIHSTVLHITIHVTYFKMRVPFMMFGADAALRGNGINSGRSFINWGVKEKVERVQKHLIVPYRGVGLGVECGWFRNFPCKTRFSNTN